jgi:hypothetical protein
MSDQRQLEDWVDSFLYFTEDTEPPETYRRWTAISTIASVLQRKCWVNWGRLTFYPNLYIVLVGPPAARKGTAMQEGRDLLDQLGVQVAADSGSWQKFINSLEESGVTDTGPDGKLYHHSSVTIFSSELTVFLGYDNHEMLSVLCDWFDCRSRFVYDTFRGGRQEVPNVWANLLGATTPQQLQAALPEGAFGSGFTSRVIHVYEEEPAKLVIKPEISELAMKTQRGLLGDLESIKAIHGEFIVNEGFETLYTNWRTDSAKRRLFPTEPRLEYYVQRRPTHLFKLAMVYSASRGSDQVITEGDLDRAITSLEKAEENMPLVFRGVGNNPLASAQTRMMELIKDRGEVRTGELFSLFANDLTSQQFREVLAGLCIMGFCAQDIMNKTDKGALITAKTPS